MSANALRNIYCFLSGILFALLQFGFLLIIQINVASTYLTYALVTICWMAGVLVGLWLKRSNALWLMVIQLSAYYAIYFMFEFLPFYRMAIVAAAVGVTASGIWAGRFFPEIFAWNGRADIIYFHENNGFILGSILFFTGFTLLGKPFLLAAPVIIGLPVILSHSFLSRCQVIPSDLIKKNSPLLGYNERVE